MFDNLILCPVVSEYSYEMEIVDHTINRCPAFAVRRHDMFCKLGFGSVSENVVLLVLCGGMAEGDKRMIVIEIAEMLEQLYSKHDSVKV